MKYSKNKKNTYTHADSKYTNRPLKSENYTNFYGKNMEIINDTWQSTWKIKIYIDVSLFSQYLPSQTCPSIGNKNNLICYIGFDHDSLICNWISNFHPPLNSIPRASIIISIEPIQSMPPLSSLQKLHHRLHITLHCDDKTIFMERHYCNNNFIYIYKIFPRRIFILTIMLYRIYIRCYCQYKDGEIK